MPSSAANDVVNSERKPYPLPETFWLLDGCELGELYLSSIEAREPVTHQEMFKKLAKEIQVDSKEAKQLKLNETNHMSFLEHSLCVCFLFLTFGSLAWIPFVVTLCCVFGSWVHVGCCFLFMVGCPSIPIEALPWPPWLLARLQLMMFRYFSFKVISYSNVHADPRLIFAGSPHGVIPMGMLMCGLISPLVSGLHLSPIVASVALRAPLWGNFLKALGCRDCSLPVVRSMFEANDTLAVLPGGISEMFEGGEDQECVLLKSRKGFVREAILAPEPYSVVPCYAFGNNRVYHCLSHPLLRWLSDRARVAFTVFWGRGFSPVPFRTPVCVVVAPPIPCPKVEDPTAAMTTSGGGGPVVLTRVERGGGEREEQRRQAVDVEVQRIHSAFVGSMCSLFERHKEAFGWGHKHMLVK